MKRSLGAYLTIGCVLTAGLLETGRAASLGSSARQLTLTIDVYNYAGVSPKTLVRAENIAAHVFWNAGVRTRWVNVDPSTSRFRYPEVALLIIQGFAGSIGASGDPLGAAPGGGPDRHLMYVFFGRVEQLALRRETDRANDAMTGVDRPAPSGAQILGVVMAHELGHLLGLNRHSQEGIMRADWDQADLEDAREGYLLLTGPQAKVMRAEVSRRLSAQHVMTQAR
jgi:hypothetical protein